MNANQTRRSFLVTASLAATQLPLIAQSASADESPKIPFRVFTSAELEQHASELHTKPGNFSLWENTPLPFTAVMTVEEKKAAKEFEWHATRDHLLLITEGTTTYEVGGSPVNGRNVKPGEWLAPASHGAETLHLHKGDWLILPRNTPHRRMTEASVTFFLISTTGEVKS